jgi:hypothetical protein
MDREAPPSNKQMIPKFHLGQGRLEGGDRKREEKKG